MHDLLVWPKDALFVGADAIEARALLLDVLFPLDFSRNLIASS
ncbi:MAG TPA: hypothetical protein PLD30_10615 [Candidatus Competibacteraceae bacterium]|nr:hypothetical protein [Candidatus Competibacteraceae bacterium]